MASKVEWALRFSRSLVLRGLGVPPACAARQRHDRHRGRADDEPRRDRPCPGEQWSRGSCLSGRHAWRGFLQEEETLVMDAPAQARLLTRASERATFPLPCPILRRSWPSSSPHRAGKSLLKIQQSSRAERSSRSARSRRWTLFSRRSRHWSWRGKRNTSRRHWPGSTSSRWAPLPISCPSRTRTDPRAPRPHDPSCHRAQRGCARSSAARDLLGPQDQHHGHRLAGLPPGPQLGRAHGRSCRCHAAPPCRDPGRS